MSKDQETTGETEQPWLQRLYDRPLVLLLLGLAVMFGFYTIWGVYEVMKLPVAKLP